MQQEPFEIIQEIMSFEIYLRYKAEKDRKLFTD